jgi:hypothetical protein
MSTSTTASPTEIPVNLTPELCDALLKAAELAELTANAHADMLDSHAPAAATERRELGRLFRTAQVRLPNARALAAIHAVRPQSASA